MHLLAFGAAALAFAVSQSLFFIAIASHKARPQRRMREWAIYMMLIVAAAANLVLYAAHLGVFVAARIHGVEIWHHVSTALS